MKWQALLLEPLIMSAIAGTRSGLLASRTSRAAGILAILAACFGGVACIAFLAGGYVWLQSEYGVQYATILTGMITAGLAMVLGIFSWGIIRYKEMRMAAYQHELKVKVESVLHSIMAEVEQPVKDYPKTAVSLAALAGYVAGDHVQDGTQTLIKTFERLRA